VLATAAYKAPVLFVPVDVDVVRSWDLFDFFVFCQWFAGFSLMAEDEE